MLDAPHTRPKGTVQFDAPIAGSKTLNRVIVEHGDGNWTIGTYQRNDPPHVRRVTPEASFSMDELQRLACAALEGDPRTTDFFGKNTGKVLAGGIVLMAMAVNLLNENPPSTPNTSSSSSTPAEA